MKIALTCIALLFGANNYLFAQTTKALLKGITDAKPQSKTQIMFLGSTHFNNASTYTKFPKADLFDVQRQKEVAEINALLKKYNPDVIMVESNPERQNSLDSLYTLYKTGKVTLKDIELGRAERYQFAYNIAKELQLPRIFGVDHYESVSNRILTTGDNINYFQAPLEHFASIGSTVTTEFNEGKLSLKQLLLFLNEPTVLDFTYRVMFVNPARVKNGKFLIPPTQHIDTTNVSPEYIGAEYISLFYEREQKIYSNIVTTQAAQKGKRLLVVMGQRHAAVLTKIFANDPEYKVVPFSRYVK